VLHQVEQRLEALRRQGQRLAAGTGTQQALCGIDPERAELVRNSLCGLTHSAFQEISEGFNGSLKILQARSEILPPGPTDRMSGSGGWKTRNTGELR
jgi:hypothetical protein